MNQITLTFNVENCVVVFCFFFYLTLSVIIDSTFKDNKGRQQITCKCVKIYFLTSFKLSFL